MTLGFGSSQNLGQSIFFYKIIECFLISSFNVTITCQFSRISDFARYDMNMLVFGICMTVFNELLVVKL